MADDVFVAADSYVEDELKRRLEAIETEFGADVIVCMMPILPPFDDFVRQRIEDVPKKRPNLLVILETDGGSIETCERIADVFRHHYAGEISFLIPNSAMSAGTILVMSGDRILMDYYSVLGPIDPQIRNSDGEWVPALGYLEKFREIVAKSKRGALSQAELAFLLDKFDPAQLHGRGISLSVVRQSLNLVVEDFGTDPGLAGLNEKVRAFYRLHQDYLVRRGWNYTVQTREGRFAF